MFSFVTRFEGIAGRIDCTVNVNAIDEPAEGEDLDEATGDDENEDVAA
jgi:hypothetical protein